MYCRSVGLLLQISLPCALFAEGPSELCLKGGTNAEMAPQIDYTLKVLDFRNFVTLFPTSTTMSNYIIISCTSFLSANTYFFYLFFCLVLHHLHLLLCLHQLYLLLCLTHNLVVFCRLNPQLFFPLAFLSPFFSIRINFI